MMQVPRQFWLMLNKEQPSEPVAFECLAYVDEVKHPALKAMSIHVVEYWAYKQVADELERLRQKYVYYQEGGDPGA